jgi:hypothetical protein
MAVAARAPFRLQWLFPLWVAAATYGPIMEAPIKLAPGSRAISTSQWPGDTLESLTHEWCVGALELNCGKDVANSTGQYCEKNVKDVSMILATFTSIALTRP